MRTKTYQTCLNDTMSVVSKSAFGNDLDCELYLDNYLKREYLDQVPHLVQSDYDAWFVVFGEEGSGKTVDGLTMAYYLDANLSIENVVFTQDGFMDAVDNLPPGSVLVWDEADAAADHHASSQMQALKAKAKRIRKQNLIVILIQPTLLDYDKYFVLHRLRFGLQPYDYPWKDQPSRQRGYANVYNRSRLRDLYHDAKRARGDLSVGNPNAHVRFTDNTRRDGFPVPIHGGSRYDEKKQEVTESLTEDEDDEPVEIQSFGAREIHGLLEYCKRKGELKEVAEVLKWDYSTLQTRKSRLMKS